MTLSKQNLQAPEREQGSALLVAMIMIFMLSIMGVSAMKGSTLERRMATNSIQTATNFQSAESTSEMALNNPNNLTRALNNANFMEVGEGILRDETKINLPVDLRQDVGVASEASLQFVGYGPAIGYSSKFLAYRFEAVGNAEVEAVRASAGVTQGAYRIAPAR